MGLFWLGAYPFPRAWSPNPMGPGGRTGGLARLPVAHRPNKSYLLRRLGIAFYLPQVKINGLCFRVVFQAGHFDHLPSE